MANAYVRKSLSEIEADLTLLATAGANPVYGLSANDLKTLSDQAAKLAAVATGLINAAATEKAARQARDAALADAQAMMQRTASFIYSRSPATDAQLAAAGLAPRRSGSVRPYPAVRVAGLVATPFADGTVRLAWDRGANPKSATFVVEASADGQAWTYLTSTSRIGLTAEGFAPGAPAWFRVVAKTSTAAAVPSASVSVYAPEPARVELRLAA